MARRKPGEKARDALIHQCHVLTRYWATLPDKTNAQRCEGLTFALLAMIDGGYMLFSDEVSGDLAGGLHEVFMHRLKGTADGQ